MALTFRQVRHFMATAETGQVSAAAATLNVTQSAVTASIKALETELGRKLFDRHSNGVTLTPRRSPPKAKARRPSGQRAR